MHRENKVLFLTSAFQRVKIVICPNSLISKKQTFPQRDTYFG